MLKWLNKQWKERQLFWSCLAALAGLVFTVVPLYIIALFNYPTSDDFAYADSLYRNIHKGAGISTMIRDAFSEALSFYHGWQGRYFDDLVSAFGIGVAVPKYYFIGTYVVLTGFVCAELLLIYRILHHICGWDKKVVWSISAFVLMMQIWYVPYASEAFYWYVGATGYTGTYMLMLFLFAALTYYYGVKVKKKKIVPGIAAMLLAVMIGGSNYATGLVTLEILVLAFVIGKLTGKRCLFLFCITMEYTCAFLLNALSPGNANRMHNVEGMSPLHSILESLHRAGIFCTEWFHLPILIMILFVTAISLGSLSVMKFRFRLPGLMTLCSFGLYASVLTPPLFADGTWGPGRLINILYYLYIIFSISNVLYWAGWLVHRSKKAREMVQRTDLENRVSIPMLLAALVCILISVKWMGLQSVNPASAALSLLHGEAQEYRTENEERWAVYTDSKKADAVVPAFSARPYVLYHDDITADPTDWRNTCTASFFGKKSVKLEAE